MSSPTISQQAESAHLVLKTSIIAHTGHEYEAHTRSDEDRYRAHLILAAEMNKSLRLGQDAVDQQLLALMNTTLSYTNRYADDPFIKDEEGETPVKHSACAANDYMLNCYKGAVRLHRGEEPSAAQATVHGAEFNALVRDGGLMCLWHDMDEIYGEPTTVQSRSAKGEAEQDSSKGIKVVYYGLKLAMHAIAEQNRTGSDEPIKAYFAECEEIRALADVKEHGFDKILDYIDAHPAPSLAPDSKARIDRALRHYALAEGQLPIWHQLTGQPQNEPSEPTTRESYLAASVKLTERGEGNSHYRHFMLTGGVADTQPGHDRPSFARNLPFPANALGDILTRDGTTPHGRPTNLQVAESNLRSAHAVPASSISALKNLTYGESKVGDTLMAAHTPLEAAVADEAVLASYRNTCMLVASGPYFVDRFPEDDGKEALKAKQEASKRRPTPEEFQQEQAQLRCRYLAQRPLATRLDDGSRVRNTMPRIVTRREMISGIQQAMGLIDQGEWRKLNTQNTQGKAVFGGICKRREPLPEEINLNQPIHQMA